MDTQWLKIKTAGLPRWAWISIIGGAVVIGLYLRTTSQPETVEEEEGEINPEESGLSQFAGTETAGGLGAAGIAGPAGNTLTPVETPVVPEGITDALTASIGSNVEAQQAMGDLAAAALAREPSERVEIINEREPAAPRESSKGLTGGGAPTRKPHHKAIPKHTPKPKAAKPKHTSKPKKPPRQKKPKQTRQPAHKQGGAGGHKPPKHNAGRQGAGHRAR